MKRDKPSTAYQRGRSYGKYMLAVMRTTRSLAQFGIAAAEANARLRVLARDFDRIAQEMRPDFIEALDLERQIRHWYWPAVTLWAAILALVVAMGGGR